MLRGKHEPPLLMRTDTRRSSSKLAASSRAHFHEYERPRAADLAHHKVDLATATHEVARDKAQPLALQIFQRALLERVSDCFRHSAPKKVVSLRMAQ